MDWDHSRDIKVRIEKERQAYRKVEKVLKSHDISLELRNRLMRCYVFSVLLYGMKAWTLSNNTLAIIRVIQLWEYGRMLSINWNQKIKNKEVLKRMRKQLKLKDKIEVEKLVYFPHVMREPVKYELLKLYMLRGMLPILENLIILLDNRLQILKIIFKLISK